MQKQIGLEYLLELNQRHSALFVRAALERKRYRAIHRTEIGALKCMDGRIHLPTLTNTPLGIIQPWRNLGGRFDLGWPQFQASIADWVSYATNRGRDCLLLVTYHFARGDTHRGCRGFNYDVVRARQQMARLVDQFNGVFNRVAVYPILVGIETDAESLILNGENGDEVDFAERTVTGEQALLTLLESLYPTIPSRVLVDLTPLIKGNLEHIQAVRASRRPVTETDHQEWTLAIGRGFDWLNVPNTALIVGPFQPDLAEPIEKAALILQNNIAVGHADRVVLMSCAPFRSAGPKQALAVLKAKFLMGFARQVISEQTPQLFSSLQCLTGVVDVHTRRLEVVTVE